jgi:hypothetical protein
MKWLWAALALLFLALALIWQMPATEVARALNTRIPATLALAWTQPRGTLPAGSARLTRHGVVLGDLAWSWRWASLAPHVEVQWRGNETFPGTGRAEVSPRWAAVAVRQAAVELSAAQISEVLPLTRALGLRGHFTLASEALRLSLAQVHGDTQITWQDAGAALLGAEPLGHYRLELRGEGARLSGRLQHLPGARLVVNGTLEWQPNRLRGQVQMRPAGDLPADVRQDLKAHLGRLTPADASGVHHFAFDLPLAP